MKDLLLKLLASQELSFEEARQMILWIMSEEAISVQAAALLALLQAKGVTVDEMAGAALALLLMWQVKCCRCWWCRLQAWF